jgi:hypothetical protein
MPDLTVEPTSVAQWQGLVRTAGEACDTRLEEPVEAYVVFMLMRFSEHTALGRDALAIRWLEGMQTAGERSGGERLRATGDECLLICGLFPQRVRRRALPFSYYVRLGRGAYHTLAHSGAADDSGPYDELARGFVSLMELLQAMRDPDPEAALQAGDAAALARQTGSRRAWDRVAPGNVTLLDPDRQRRN